METLQKKFQEKAFELLDDVESDLLDFDENPHKIEDLNSIFRIIHSIKGSSAVVGFNEVAELVHQAEEILEQIKKRRILVTKKIIDLLLIAIDRMRKILVASGEYHLELKQKTKEMIDSIKILLQETVANE
jgi:two-component system chemotaxis sensor kinase CheA